MAAPEPQEQTPSLVGVMPDVVAGLKDRPPLLFGIGAGIVLVVVLGVTTNLWLVVVVAAVLVLALAAWLLSEAQQRRRVLANRVRAKGATIGDEAAVGGLTADAGASVANTTDVRGAHIGRGAQVGQVNVRRTDEER